MATRNLHGPSARKSLPIRTLFHDLYDPAFRNRAWEAKRAAETSIERSLEAIGLIDEQHDDDSRYNDSLFR